MKNKEWETTLNQAQIIAAIRNHISTDPLIIVKDITLGIDERERIFAKIKGVKVLDAQSPDLDRKETYTRHSTGV